MTAPYDAHGQFQAPRLNSSYPLIGAVNPMAGMTPDEELEYRRKLALQATAGGTAAPPLAGVGGDRKSVV